MQWSPQKPFLSRIVVFGPLFDQLRFFSYLIGYSLKLIFIKLGSFYASIASLLSFGYARFSFCDLPFHYLFFLGVVILARTVAHTEKTMHKRIVYKEKGNNSVLVINSIDGSIDGSVSSILNQIKSNFFAKIRLVLHMKSWKLNI